MATPEAIHCVSCAKDISKSSRDQESLGPIPLATQLQERKLCLKGFFSQEAGAAISLQAIKKEREKSIAKALSIPRWKDGINILPRLERHDNFQLQAFQCIIL